MNSYSDELDRSTSAPTYTSSTTIKYMATRRLCPNIPNSYQGIRRSLDFSVPISSFVNSPNISRISSSDSIDDDDDDDDDNQRNDLTKLTDRLTNTSMNCSSLDVDNRIQEMQLEWLNKNANKNASIIEKMFRIELQTGRQRIEDTLRYKTDYERQLNEIHRTTLANDEYYQQLLAKRNVIHRELFEYQRQLTQNRAESEFIRQRIQMFNDEIEFYQFKNHSLAARKYKLQYDLDEDILVKQVLQMECDVLENEKITNEDIHLSSIDDLRNSLNRHRIGIRQPASSFREQLNHEIRQIRLEYDRKLRILREELHRKYELEFHRYKISRKQYSMPIVTQEHECRLNEYQREKNEIDKQISEIHGHFQQLENQIKQLEKEIDQTQTITEGILNSRKRLVLLEQIIHEKEQQLNVVIEMQKKFQQHIDYYRIELNQYEKNNEYQRKSILRTSKSYESINVEVERDCKELNSLFNQYSNVNTIAVINILCNRNVTQRLQIREIFRTLFNQNLGDVIDLKMNGNTRKILKTLFLSPVEYDCFELRRILKCINIDDISLIEIFFTRSKNHIKIIIDNYLKLFKTTLEEDLRNMKEIPSKQIFLNLFQMNRLEDEEINEETLVNDARNLHEKHLTWVQLLSNRSNEQLKQIFNVYQQFSRVDIEETLKNETDLCETLTAIVRIVRNQSRFFADELCRCFQSSTINENTLNRIIITRCEIDIVQIQLEYEKISQRTLYDQIQINTHGDYQRALLILLRSRIESIDKEFRSTNFIGTSKKNERTVQWKDTNGIRFDRNNQAKLTTLSTINSKLLRSQYLEQYSHENDDE